VIDAD
jgi:hypothetical protein